MLTVAAIIDRALQIAKAPNYTAQALDLFNAIQSDLCESYDYALAAGKFLFDFNPALQSDFGSGPYNLPLDYLRASGSTGDGQYSVFWTLLGVPYPLIPCDLNDFYMQVQQAGNQSYPWLWATDMTNLSLTSAARYRAAFVMDLNAASFTQVAPAGLSVAAGDAISGTGIIPGTMVTSYSGTALVLSQAPAATITGASVFTGTCPQVYVYPPPSGAYPVTCIYQRQMPPIVDTSTYCWFPDDGYLIEELAGRVMEITDDARTTEFMGNGMQPGRSGNRLRKYNDKKDDKPVRPQTVELDRRRFGPSFRTLPNTKVVGW